MSSSRPFNCWQIDWPGQAVGISGWLSLTLHRLLVNQAARGVEKGVCGAGARTGMEVHPPPLWLEVLSYGLSASGQGPGSSAVQGLLVVTDVYLDDILVSASSTILVSRVLRKTVHKLRSAGFIISPKSETTPSQRLSFIGKRIDSRQGSIANSPEAVAAALRIWLRDLGRGGISPHELSRLLDRLQWLARPGVGAAPFLAGACRQIGAGRSHFTRALARSLGTVIAFSAPPLRISRRHRRRTSVFFSDAAEAPRGFRVGVVGSPGVPWCARHGSPASNRLNCMRRIGPPKSLCTKGHDQWRWV